MIDHKESAQILFIRSHQDLKVKTDRLVSQHEIGKSCPLIIHANHCLVSI